MDEPTRRRPTSLFAILAATAVLAAVASCTTPELPDSPYPPGLDPDGDDVDGLIVGNRLMVAGEYELALRAFTRAALDHGLTTEVLTSLGTANMGLGRFGQAETLLRRAVEDGTDWPVAWNNLGVLLVEMGEYPEAANIFERAYALDNGESDAIRDNLRLALAKMENPDNIAENDNEYTLVQQGEGEFALRKAP